VYIEGIEHARLKETDRVANISQELTKLGAYVKEESDRITISAPRDLRNATLDAHSDHRLFMAFTIASMLTEQSIVNGVDSVDVSYPQFVSEMRRLGANIQPIS
jgi:3-phosphoshikimate 1-carboxyvinyltransferase